MHYLGTLWSGSSMCSVSKSQQGVCRRFWGYGHHYIRVTYSTTTLDIFWTAKNADWWSQLVQSFGRFRTHHGPGKRPNVDGMNQFEQVLIGFHSLSTCVFCWDAITSTVSRELDRIALSTWSRSTSVWKKSSLLCLKSCEKMYRQTGNMMKQENCSENQMSLTALT